MARKGTLPYGALRDISKLGGGKARGKGQDDWGGNELHFRRANRLAKIEDIGL
jgi:hypothetical protein